MQIGSASSVTRYVNRGLRAVATLPPQSQPGFSGGALRALHVQPLHLPLGPFRTVAAGFPPNPPPAGGPSDDDDDDRDDRGHFPWEATAIGVIVAGLALLVASCGEADSEGGSFDDVGPTAVPVSPFDGAGVADASDSADSVVLADAPIPTPDQEESADDGTKVGPDVDEDADAVDTTDALADAPDTTPLPDVAPTDVDANTPEPDVGPDISDTAPPPVDAQPDVQPVPDTVDDDADGATDATIDEPDFPVAPDLTEPDVPPAEDLVAADDIADVDVMDTAQPDTPATSDIPIIVEDTSDMVDTTGADTADVDIVPPPDAYFTDFICKTLVAHGIDTVSGNPLPKADFLSKLFTKPAPNTQLAVQFDVVDKPANAFVYEVALCYQTKAIAPTTVDPALTDANGKFINIPHCDSKTWAPPLGLPLKPDNVAAIGHQYTAPPPTKYAEWKLLTKLTTTLFSGLLFAKDPVVAAQVVLQPEPGQYCFYGFSSGICDNPPPKCP